MATSLSEAVETICAFHKPYEHCYKYQNNLTVHPTLQSPMQSCRSLQSISSILLVKGDHCVGDCLLYCTNVDLFSKSTLLYKANVVSNITLADEYHY